MMQNPVFVTGGSGQLGGALLDLLAGVAPAVAPSRAELDLSDLKRSRQFVRDVKPRAIFNTAAFTAVDAAESNEQAATVLNRDLPGMLAEEARAQGIPLVHFSTDYVFDGCKSTPYVESDSANPLSAYGRTKREGELAVDSAGGPTLILRTSWIFSRTGSNFVRTVLRLADEREVLSIVADQRGAPTWAVALAASALAAVGSFDAHATEKLQSLRGVYHVTAAGEATWFDVANFVLKHDRQRQRRRLREVVPTTTAAYGAPAARPANSRLSNAKWDSTFGIELSHWHSQVLRCFSERLSPEAQ